MKFQKYVYLISILIFVFILQGCSVTVGLSTSLSDFVLHSIKPNSRDVVKYELRTRLSEPYSYKVMGRKYNFYISNSLIENIESYLFTKFNKVSKDLDDEYNVFIKIIFDSFGIYNKIVNYKVEMTISVEVTRYGREFAGREFIKKEIHSKYYNKVDTEAVSGATNKFIIMLDKYLVSLGL